MTDTVPDLSLSSVTPRTPRGGGDASSAAGGASESPSTSAVQSQVNTHRSTDALPSVTVSSTPRGGGGGGGGGIGIDGGSTSRGGGQQGNDVGVGSISTSSSKHHLLENENASEASKAAAAEAQASVLKEGLNGLIGLSVPSVGLMSFASAPTGMNVPGTMMGLGEVPQMQEVQLVTVPRLDDLIIKALADNYHVCPAFDWIPYEYLENVVALLDPGKLDFISASSLIQSEIYWKRLSIERWKPKVSTMMNIHQHAIQYQHGVSTGDITSALSHEFNLSSHGGSWKRFYCEKHLSECLEKYYPSSKQSHNYERLVKEVDACKSYVHTLTLSSLLSHLNLSDLLYDFPHLQSLHIKYGPTKELGMDYDPVLFGMNMYDAECLAGLMKQTQTIHTLVLNENCINDETLILLLSGLITNNGTQVLGGNSTLTSLDLSHNKITDFGVSKLCVLLDGGVSQSRNPPPARSAESIVGSTLITLNLHDNLIRSPGATSLGRALQYNRGLTSLNLGLNHLSDDGCQGLFDGIRKHETIKNLSVQACNLTEVSNDSLIQLVKENKSLETLNISCNNSLCSSVSACTNLLDAIKMNESIVEFDTRKTGVTSSTTSSSGNVVVAIDQEMKALLAKRLAQKKQQTRKALQKEATTAGGL